MKETLLRNRRDGGGPTIAATALALVPPFASPSPTRSGSPGDWGRGRRFFFMDDRFGPGRPAEGEGKRGPQDAGG